MSVTKYPIFDKDFLIKMIGACRDAEERGLVRILDISGMHVSALRNVIITSRGNRNYLSWKRPKTNKTLEVLIPPDNLLDIQGFLAHKHHCRSQYWRIIREIGQRAGFEGVAPMTFRHNRCIRSLKTHNNNPFVVAQDMGCTHEVVFRNYSKLSEEQMAEGKENEQTR